VPLFIFDGTGAIPTSSRSTWERFYLARRRTSRSGASRGPATDAKIPMGSPVNPPIARWGDSRSTERPGSAPVDKARFAEVAGIMAEYGPDRYYMAACT